MVVAQVGPKNYPPSHGGVEKVVFDISTIESMDFQIITEWKNDINNENVTQMPKGLFRQIYFLLGFTKKNKVDIVHFHKETFVIHALALSFFKRKTVLTFHGLAWRIKRWNAIQRGTLFTIDFIACLVLRNIVFVSETDYLFYKKFFFWKTFNLIPNGTICPKLLSNSPNSRISETLCYLGRISPEKNIINLTKAADKFRIRLHLYGPIDKKDQKFNKSLLQLLESSVFVVWKGAVDYQSVGDTLRKYYSFINPSFSEGMPVSVLEAGANGCHLILSNIPQHCSLNYPHATYIACDNIDLSNCLKDTVCQENLIHTKSYFSLENMISKYQLLYEKVTK